MESEDFIFHLSHGMKRNWNFISSLFLSYIRLKRTGKWNFHESFVRFHFSIVSWLKFHFQFVLYGTHWKVKFFISIIFSSVSHPLYKLNIFFFTFSATSKIQKFASINLLLYLILKLLCLHYIFCLRIKTFLNIFHHPPLDW